jgi:hypothetical protein
VLSGQGHLGPPWGLAGHLYQMGQEVAAPEGTNGPVQSTAQPESSSPAVDDRTRAAPRLRSNSNTR